MNKKIMGSLELETQIDQMHSENRRLKQEIDGKDNEITLQQLEITNIQEALEDMHENKTVKEVRRAEKPEDTVLVHKYKAL